MLNIFRKMLMGMLIVCLAEQGSNAQVQTMFQPSVNGRSLDGIMNFQVRNETQSELTALLRIVIREDAGGSVTEINVRNVSIRRGMNLFSRSMLKQAQLSFASNEAGGMFRQTGKLPEGDYEYCYEINITESKPAIAQDYYENCFHFSLRPMTPLLLVDPAEEEKTCNQKPSFTWQPPLPLDFKARYQVIVSEVKEKQAPVEALSFNQPVINVSGLAQARLTFPAHVKELEKGKTYAWQVYYSVDRRLVLKSEIWTFKVECDEDKSSVPDESYRELKTGVEGDYYLAKQKLRFAVNNPYNDGELKYFIAPLDNPGKPVQQLPKLKAVTGFNKYTLDLDQYRAFRNGEHYQLTVELANGQKLILRFTYED
jgi:hypothetical protein